MKLVETTCPNCGAALRVNMDRGYCFCEYCGTQLILDDEAQHIHLDNAEQAGYEFERGRQRAQAEYQTQTPYQPYQEVVQPKRRNTFLWVLGWIFIFPLPLTLIMSKNKTMPLWVRILIIVAAWAVYVAIALSANSG